MERAEAYFVEYSLNVTEFILVLIVGKFLVSLLLKYLKQYFKKSDRLEDTVEIFIYRVASNVSWAVIFMIALSALGVDIAPLIAGFGVAGFVVGFALKDTLNNFVAGAMLIFYKPFRVGEIVNTAGIKGKVIRIGISLSVIETDDKLIVFIPNSKVWGAPIKNYSRLECKLK